MLKKRILLSGLLLLVSVSARADDAVLLQRIVALEKRLAELEGKLAPVLEIERVKAVAAQQRELARERMLMDAEVYSRADLNLIEKLYQTAAKDWTSEAAGKNLELLMRRFPLANLTGCAVLSRAQLVGGSEQLNLLQTAIEKYSGCRYASGVQVGAYARLYLAMRHKKEGDDEAAAKQFKEIRSLFPDAVDHKGTLLTSHLIGMED